MSGVTITNTEKLDQYLFALYPISRSPSNTTVIMRLERYKAEREIERSTDKEADTKLILTDIMWDLQNEQEHARRYSPRTFRPRASNVAANPQAQPQQTQQRSAQYNRPQGQPQRGGGPGRGRGPGRGAGRGGRRQGRGSPAPNRFGNNANQQNNRQNRPSSQGRDIRCLGCYGNHPVMQCPTTSREDARRLLDEYMARNGRQRNSQQPNNNQRPQGNAVAQQPAAPPASANATQSTRSTTRRVAFVHAVEANPPADMSVARAPEHSDDRSQSDDSSRRRGGSTPRVTTVRHDDEDSVHEQEVQDDLPDISGISFDDEVPRASTMASEPGLSAAQLSMVSDDLPDALRDGAQASYITPEAARAAMTLGLRYYIYHHARDTELFQLQPNHEIPDRDQTPLRRKLSEMIRYRWLLVHLEDLLMTHDQAVILAHSIPKPLRHRVSFWCHPRDNIVTAFSHLPYFSVLPIVSFNDANTWIHYLPMQRSWVSSHLLGYIPSQSSQSRRHTWR